jgi:phage replication-related protein YjqB (UPF0714/DUF867 family)
VADQYRSFEELAGREQESVDYQIRLHARQSLIAIMAPHGGKIEPGTSELAEYIARQDFSFYAFEGIRSGNNGRLSLPFDRFDEPECSKLLRRCGLAVVIQGIPGKNRELKLAGGHAVLREQLAGVLRAAGFEVLDDDCPVNPFELCNRRGPGVRIAVSKKLRDRFVSYPRDMDRFVSCIRAVLLQAALDLDRAKPMSTSPAAPP